MHNKKDISIKTATLINAGSKYVVVVWNILLSAILARLLTPEDYGIVAVTTIFTNFFTVLANMGLGTGIIQNKTLTEEEINGIFSFTFYVGIALGVFFWLLSFPMSFFYKNDVYKSIGVLLAIALFFSTINMIPNALLLKDKQFMKVAVRNVMVPIMTSIIAVIMAFGGWKYYSLVWQSVLQSALIFFWNITTAKRKYHLYFQYKFSFSGLKKIASFSGFQFVYSLVNYFSRNLDNLLISRFFGENILGFYDKAYKLTLYPVNNLTHAITPVLHPIFSEYQNDKEYIYARYLKIIYFLSALGIFISVFCFSAAEEIILIIFGEKWIMGIPCFSALSLSIWAQMLGASVGAVFQSLGCTKEMLKVGIINTSLTLIAIGFGIASKDISQIATYVSVAYNIHFVVIFYVLIVFVFKKKIAEFVKDIYKDIILLIVLFISVVFYPFHVNNVLFSIIIKFIYVGSIYCILLLGCGKHKFLLEFLKLKKKSR